MSGELVFGEFYSSSIKLRIKDDTVETSQCARVCIQDALRLFKLCKACHDKGAGMKAFSHRVGGFPISSISNNGDAVVGCHSLEYAEMERLSKLYEMEAM